MEVMSRLLKSVMLCAALAASPALARTRLSPDAQLQKLLAGRTAGKPVDCISLRTANSSEVIDGKAIIYKIGNQLYVNQPRSGAEALNDDDVLVTKTFSTQLCSTDSIRLVDRYTGIPTGFVLLGQFVPYKKTP